MVRSRPLRAGMLAVPVFLVWNRARLRREVGRRGALFEHEAKDLLAAKG